MSNMPMTHKTIVTWLLLAACAKAGAQTLSCQQLLGSWSIRDSSQNEIFYDFLTCATVSIRVGYDTAVLGGTYSIVNLKDCAELYIRFTDVLGLEHTDRSLVKMISPDSLKIQLLLLNGQLTQWQTPENSRNTALLLRKKGG